MINICLTEEVVKRLEETEDGQKLLSEFHVSLQELTAIADRIDKYVYLRLHTMGGVVRP